MLFSLLSSCVKAVRCMTTCTRRALLLVSALRVPNVSQTCWKKARSSRISRPCLPIPPKRKRSNCSLTPIWRCALPILTSSTAMLKARGWTANRLSKGYAWIRVSATTITTRPSATAATACRKIPSSCWRTTNRSRTISSRLSSMPTVPVKTLSRILFSPVSRK